MVGALLGFVRATSASSAPCTVDYVVVTEWPQGFLAFVEVTNSGEPVDRWKLEFDLPEDQSVHGGWFGRFRQNGSTVTVESHRWNSSVDTGGSIMPGFVARKSDGPAGAATNFRFNGVACDDGSAPVDPEPSTTTAAPVPTVIVPDTSTTVAPVPSSTTTSSAPAPTPAPTEPSPTEPSTTESPSPTVPSTTAAPTTEPSTTAAPTTAAPTTVAPTTETSPSTSEVTAPPTPSVEANLRLIMDNPTRNTQFDDNPYRDVPMDQISVDDLTVNGDIYTEGHIDTSNSGYFRVKCEVSHFAYDDPIVFPGEPGRAHLHMFFGNTNTNAYSTFDSLLNSGSGSCNGEDLNRSAYWIPAMLDRDGNALIPFEIMVYYKNDNFRLNGANELVSPFPDDLQMVIGNGGATSPQNTLSGGPGSLPVVSFQCGPAYGAAPRSATIPDCQGTGAGPYAGRALEMRIAFPQCYNPDAGTYLRDGSHMSYSENGYYGAKCPDSHPYDVSSIMYRIFFNPDDYGGSLTDLHLSSDVRHDGILPGGTTAHADWFGAWHPEAMRMWVDNCNNQQVDCEIGLLDRDPAISMVKRKRNFYPSGYRARAEDLIELCPGRQFDPSDPVRSVASCRHN